MTRLSHVLGLLMLVLLLAPDLRAQEVERPKLGLGFGAVLSSTEGLGVGLRARAAWPVNSDMSLALGSGITGFVLEGRDEASYLVDPQASIIVTLNATGERTPYLLGGLGAAIPLNDRDRSENGPYLHFGIGWVQGLRETVLYYEIDPAMIVGEEAISFNVPFRIGVIF